MFFLTPSKASITSNFESEPTMHNTFPSFENLSPEIVEKSEGISNVQIG